MNLKNTLYAAVALLMLTSVTLSSCKGKGDVTMATDSVLMEDSFKKSNGELCKIRTKVVTAFPQEYKDKETLEKLQKLFCHSVLNSPDNVSTINDALNLYAKTLLTQNTPMPVEENDSIAEEDYDPIDIHNLEFVVRITNVYNKNEVLTFCQEETVKKNDKVTSVKHKYVSIDLASMKRVGLGDLFAEDSYSQLAQMLKSKLLKDKGAKAEEELNDLGYDLSNLSVTSNFYFTDDGLAWCYLPDEPDAIAIPYVGETTIVLPYVDLMRFNFENSLLNRF